MYEQAGKADVPDASKATGIYQNPHGKPFPVLWHEANAPLRRVSADRGVLAEKAQHRPFPA